MVPDLLDTTPIMDPVYRQLTCRGYLWQAHGQTLPSLRAGHAVIFQHLGRANLYAEVMLLAVAIPHFGVQMEQV